jgi:poly-gamma-glutamate capsule biosynthesis protein CapA/YwtB (metallophosphatase superfamily)
MAKKSNNGFTIFAVGDLVLNREKPEAIFTHVSHILKQGDMVIGHLEGAITDKASYKDSNGWGPHFAHPKNVRGLISGGFNVISWASNNALDFGPDAFLDTKAQLEAGGLKVTGAGKDIEEAREPAIIKAKGVRVGVLSYCTICQKGYAAREDQPGIAPLRAWTSYHQTEPEQPGTPCEVVTWPYQDDLAAMVEDVKKLKSKVDVVALTFHWGIHHTPKTIAMYQPIMAHAAIDAGADIIFGAHPHILKGVEIYKGKVIFYSLNMFAFDWPKRKPRYGAMDDSALRYNFQRDPETPNFPFCRDARKTVIAQCNIADKKIQKVSILPAYINTDNQPVPVSAKDEMFNTILDHMRDLTDQQKLNGKFDVVGDEIVISSSGPVRRLWMPSIAIPTVDR